MAENTTIKHLTFDDFEYDFDPSVVDDMEFLELSERVEHGDLLAYPALCRLFLGKGYDDAKAHFVEKYGKFTATKCGEMFEYTIKHIDPKE